MTPIYLDYNATTPIDQKVLEQMMPYLTQKFGNAASKLHPFGWEANAAVDLAREQIAKGLGCEPGELSFCSGATEAINLAIKGAAEMLSSKNHLIIAATEHSAVLDTAASLASKGISTTILTVDSNGLINPDDFKNALQPNTFMACVMAVNNETGVIQDLKTLGNLARINGTWFMVDGTQAPGKINIRMDEYPIDIYCISAHKFYGPKGIGALFTRRKKPRITLNPQLHGGGHEFGRRSGTLNVPAIVGMAQAFNLCLKSPEEIEKITSLRNDLEKALKLMASVKINGEDAPRAGNTSSVLFYDRSAEMMIKNLYPLCLSLGSACSSANAKPSHVLKAMGLSPADCLGSMRISLGRFTTDEEIKTTISIFEKVLQ